jgi:pyrroline-5-carboxylate reductase
MASAMIKCILENNTAVQNEITGSAPTEKRLHKIKDLFGINTTQSNVEATKSVDIIVLSLKPQLFQKVAEEVKFYNEFIQAHFRTEGYGYISWWYYS